MDHFGSSSNLYVKNQDLKYKILKPVQSFKIIKKSPSKFKLLPQKLTKNTAKDATVHSTPKTSPTLFLFLVCSANQLLNIKSASHY